MVGQQRMEAEGGVDAGVAKQLFDVIQSLAGVGGIQVT